MIRGTVEGGPKLKAAENEFEAHPGSADESLIRIRAYERWVARGRPDGSDQEDWFTAEEEMRRHAA